MCSLVASQAEGNERFKAELGAPLAAGPWYNSSVALSAEGHIATVTLPVRGSQRSSDVTVRVGVSVGVCVCVRVGGGGTAGLCRLRAGA